MNELIFTYLLDEKGNKHLTKQCVPMHSSGEFKKSISSAWTASLQTDYPIITYEPKTSEIMSDYIKQALSKDIQSKDIQSKDIQSKNTYSDAIKANAERSVLEGIEFIEHINMLLSPKSSEKYFEQILKDRIQLINAHSTAVKSTAIVHSTMVLPSTAIVPSTSLKYCCPSIKNPNECSTLSTKLRNKTDKYAIMTLMFGGDAYLPGVLLLGSSIRNVIPADVKNIELCCMVTKDVSETARMTISKIYDRIIVVNYIEIDPALIRHNIPAIRAIYAKTFTKLRIFEFTNYAKVLFLDADMLVLKPDIVSLFNLDTPACIFMGHISDNLRERFFKDFMTNGLPFKKYQKKYCNLDGKELHGNRIPYLKGRDDEITSSGMNIETSVLLIKPSETSVLERDKFIREIRTPIRGDTEMISRLFKHRLYAIEPRFFGRWVNPYEHDELVVLDLYGTNGKPWDVEKFIELTKSGDMSDMTYWWDTYVKFYEYQYNSYHNSMLDKLYTHIKSNEIINKALTRISKISM
jgi:hypothetical protein